MSRIDADWYDRIAKRRDALDAPDMKLALILLTHWDPSAMEIALDRVDRMTAWERGPGWDATGRKVVAASKP